MVPERWALPVHTAVPPPEEAEPYCTDQPVRSTSAPPRLCSSMKSDFTVVPLPPKTWLITTWAFEAQTPTLLVTVAKLVGVVSAMVVPPAIFAPVTRRKYVVLIASGSAVENDAEGLKAPIRPLLSEPLAGSAL